VFANLGVNLPPNTKDAVVDPDLELSNWYLAVLPSCTSVHVDPFHISVLPVVGLPKDTIPAVYVPSPAPFDLAVLRGTPVLQEAITFGI
jgi:hypothetical protein